MKGCYFLLETTLDKMGGASLRRHSTLHSSILYKYGFYILSPNTHTHTRDTVQGSGIAAQLHLLPAMPASFTGAMVSVLLVSLVTYFHANGPGEAAEDKQVLGPL